MVDYRASVKSFDHEFDTVIHSGVNFDHTILDNLHHSGSFVNWENLCAFIEFCEGHTENNFVDGLIWDFLQVVNSFKGTLQENFEIIIISNCPIDQFFFKEWELLK